MFQHKWSYLPLPLNTFKVAHAENPSVVVVVVVCNLVCNTSTIEQQKYVVDVVYA